MGTNHKIALFEQKEIRKIWDNNIGDWLFSIIDVIGALEVSDNPRNYWKVLKHRLIKEGANETVTNCNQLKMLSLDGKMRLTDVGNSKNILRIIQSIPSPKAEPFKKWLAQVGYES